MSGFKRERYKYISHYLHHHEEPKLLCHLSRWPFEPIVVTAHKIIRQDDVMWSYLSLSFNVMPTTDLTSENASEET